MSIMDSLDGNGEEQTQPQALECTQIDRNAARNNGNNTKHTGETCDSPALVKQLQDLWLNDDEEVLEQILTSGEPEALSELSAARNSKSVIPLFTEKDGREFSILAGSSAYSNWDGQYPMEFSPATKRIRKLSDPTLAEEKITTYQNDALKQILAAVCATEDAVEFRRPVQVLRPKIWDNYKKLIAEPIDIETMQHMLFHNRYATMWEFRRHVDLLEENAQKYNAKHSASIVTAAIHIRSDIYRRMDGIPAEPPHGHHGVSLVRRIIYADDHDSAAAPRFVTDEEANGSKAGARHTDNPTFFLPLGRLGVSRKAGDEEVIATPYIVVMDIESSYKSLWLYKDNYTPVGLPSDKKTLLDFGGRCNFTITKLADDIDEWKPISGRGCRGSKAKKAPILRWGKVKDLIRKTSHDRAVLFDVVKDHQQAKAAIEEGWDRSTESSDKEKPNSFVVADGVPGGRDSDYNDPAAGRRSLRPRLRRGAVPHTEWSSDSDDTIDKSEASDDSEPPRKRVRPAMSARKSL